MADHYISRIENSRFVIHVYHGQAFILNLDQFGRMIHRDLVTDDDRLEKLRSLIASSMVLIHTWTRERKDEDLINANYSSYEDFFDTMLKYMVLNEPDISVRSLIQKKLSDWSKRYALLESYGGSLKEYLHSGTEILEAVLLGTMFYRHL